MNTPRVLRSRRGLATLAAVVAAVAGGVLMPTAADAVRPAADTARAAAPTSVTLPPTHADFDYQIGGAYTPPDGVEVVSRAHESTPADGLYNICYVNAFQTQPGAEEEWDSDLLLRDDAGEVVYDSEWGEAVLDLTTKDKRERIAKKVNGWVDECAEKGFQAVEPDNYDTFDRYADYLTPEQAKSLLGLIADHAHERNLAVAQKNTVELSADRESVGLDFAIAEECGKWTECDGYVEEFGDHVIVIEYSAEGLATACEGWSDRLSIVRRDKDVRPIGHADYLRETC
ncbi:endo alpha-1,4 polygalactosaminidase [Streptomyces daliensis]|uniref:Endo alpha-1,4 polygalactosaminidase n=1 Tax=Streptomyces daliensis TaxID=299421 RepID=A0A8T4J5V7_9ACTN|nr:endo alpha-1,4 polygalactosaminidase [Streptomyces daliensis]